MERAVALEGGPCISLNVLPDKIAGYAAPRVANDGMDLVISAEGVDFEKQMAEVERRYLQSALESAGGVRTRAAELLNMSYRSFRHFAKKHSL